MSSGSNRATRGALISVPTPRVSPAVTSSATAFEAIDIELTEPGRPARSDHFVQFYQRDDFLVRSVGRFVIQGIAGGGSALLLATPAHREAIAAHLKAAGLDAAGLATAGRYLALDAAETLGKLLVDEMPDAKLFEQHIGAMVAKLTAGKRPLSAFGEMVALLWAEGRNEAALKLEELWNALSERHVFSLFCAYPMTGFANGVNRRPFLHVCGAHSRVLPAEDFPLSPEITNEQLRAVSVLQQQAASLEAEIAERRKIEERLRRREAELSACVESAMIAMHWVDANGIILWANGAELALRGYSAEEFIGRELRDFHVDGDAQDLLDRLTRGEKIHHYETHLRCKNGTIKTVLIDASAIWDGDRFLHTQCFTRDITGRRQMEEERSHLAAIVESSDDAIVSKSLTGIIRSWNRGAQRIFGYTAAETIGQPVTMLIPADRQDEEPQILARLQRGERVDHFETIRQRKDGKLLDISLTISPVRDAEGRIIGASKIARDITEQKAAQKALELARAELARANLELEERVQQRTASLREAIAQMEEFSYTVSHDLRAPLRGMLVYSQAILEDYGSTLDPQARHCLARIAENATRLDKMVSDLLTFSRVSRAELRMERVPLDKLVREIIQQYPRMRPPKVLISIAPLHDVIGHEPSLTQVISNLLGNAVKFVAEGTTPTIRVWTELQQGGVRLFIQDNGIGVKPEHQPRLFRMFERLHPDLPYEGTGVGLAIVRKAANRMGGDVGLISDGVNGSTFWVQLQAPGGAA